MSFVPQFVALEHQEDGTVAKQDIFEYRLDRRLTKAAMEWAWANPARVAELAGIKLARMWNIWPNEPSFRSWPVRLIVLMTYTPLMCLGLIGVWRFSSRGLPYILDWLPAVYF